MHQSSLKDELQTLLVFVGKVDVYGPCNYTRSSFHGKFKHYMFGLIKLNCLTEQVCLLQMKITLILIVICPAAGWRDIRRRWSGGLRQHHGSVSIMAASSEWVILICNILNSADLPLILVLTFDSILPFCYGRQGNIFTKRMSIPTLWRRWTSASMTDRSGSNGHSSGVDFAMMAMLHIIVLEMALFWPN